MLAENQMIVYVVVIFFILGNFCLFFLLLGMVMYAKEVETKVEIIKIT